MTVRKVLGASSVTWEKAAQKEKNKTYLSWKQDLYPVNTRKKMFVE